ncbi:hypothetical protein H4Q26_011452 [Puccinia striiformis f. sp. tritici PST-130]|nr:hypothetical protein H4Q26_011452 [Puccinia striiformis f. sp. tritici PST-130]
MTKGGRKWWYDVQISNRPLRPVETNTVEPRSRSKDMGIFRTESLHDATVLITGASGGIGAATAILFARAGANLIITARRESNLKEVKLECEKANKESGIGHGGQVSALVLDMQDPKAIESFLDRVPSELQKIDVLVNNAGLVYGRDQVGELNLEEVQVMIRPHKDDQPDCESIINIGSIAGREPYAGGSIYCATKHAVNAFSGALLRELVSTPLRVSEIQPGMVETEFSVTRFRGDRNLANSVYEEDIAEEIVWCAARPPHVNIAELFVLPTAQASATLSHRQSIHVVKLQTYI